MRQLTKVIHLDKIPSGTAQQRKIAVQNGRVRSYPSKSLEEARRIYDVALKQIEKPEQPLSGAIALSLSFFYKNNIKKRDNTPKLTRPDCDNIAKVFIDALMHNGFIAEDSLIYQLHINKYWNYKANGDSSILMRISSFDLEDL